MSQTIEGVLVGVRLDSSFDGKLKSIQHLDKGVNTTKLHVLDEVQRLTHERDAAVNEKDRANNMLALLKKHVSETEISEEDKFEPRLQAELNVSLEEHKNICFDAGSESSPAAEKALSIEKQINRQLNDDVHRLRSIVEAKDIELANLHLALGELSFENEVNYPVCALCMKSLVSAMIQFCGFLRIDVVNTSNPPDPHLNSLWAFQMYFLCSLYWFAD